MDGQKHTGLPPDVASLTRRAKFGIDVLLWRYLGDVSEAFSGSNLTPLEKLAIAEKGVQMIAKRAQQDATQTHEWAEAAREKLRRGQSGAGIKEK